MKYWDVEFGDEARKDHRALDIHARVQVNKAIRKVSQNPLPQKEGGYGKPLGHKSGKNLTGLCKIKLLKLGIRVVYRIVRTEETMKIVVIAARADDEVYSIAARRMELE